MSKLAVKYSTKSKKIKTKPDYRPTNCGEPEDVISNLGTRTAYTRAADHIDKDPYKNCCTVIDHEDDNGLKLYMWKATELPVKLTKNESNTTFLCFKELEYLKC